MAANRAAMDTSDSIAARYAYSHPLSILLRGEPLVSKAASIGKVAIVNTDDRFSIWSPLALLRPDPAVVSAAFLWYCLRSAPAQDAMKLACTSNTQKNISMADLGAIRVPVPPILEQRAIADYLDRETARIDALIAAKRRMSELLIKRLDGVVEFLVDVGRCGEITDRSILPVGTSPYPVMKLRYVAKLQAGEAITSEHIESSGQYPVYGGNGVRGYSDRFTHDGDAVLIGRQGALCGNINYATGRFWASEHAIVSRAAPGTDLTWFGELLRVMRMNQYSQSAAQPGLSVEKIANLLIVVPPLNE